MNVTNCDDACISISKTVRAIIGGHKQYKIQKLFVFNLSQNDLQKNISDLFLCQK